MNGDALLELLRPLIGQYGSVSMLIRRIGPVAFSMAEDKMLTGVEVLPDGLVRLERKHGWAVIDPAEVMAVVWNDDSGAHPGQFL
jgi:hypothetical protein